MKSLTFTDLMQQQPHEPIWVVNTSKGSARGNVFFTVPTTTGQGVDQVTVISSFIAQCLTETVTRKQLLDSSAFRRAVQRKLLRIVTEEEAAEIMKKPGAEEERERVQSLDINSATAEAQFGLGTSAEDTQKSLEDISIPVQQFAELLETTTDIEALNTLRNLGELTQKEYKFVLKKAKELGKAYEQTGRYCAGQLAQLKDQ